MNRTTASIAASGKAARIVLLLLAGGLLAGSTVGALCWAWGYYVLPRAERPLHACHALLRASGRAGLILGIVAAVLFVLNLGYLVRKRLIKIRWLGSLRAWMDCHTVTGAVGMMLVLFHAAFAPYSPLGILAFSALAITILTGVVGRYFYAKVPRSLEGRELELEQVRDRLGLYRHELEDAGVKADWLPAPLRPEDYIHPKSLLGHFITVVRGDHQSRHDYRQLRRTILSSPELRRSARRVLPLARAFYRHRHWLARYHELRGLLASWRFLHRWLAIVMLGIAGAHIGLAVWYGDLWIMGGTP